MEKRNKIYFFHKEDPVSVKEIANLYEFAERYDFSIVEDHKDANIIVSIGGDGTFLQAVRKTGFREDCLYAGISSDKTLGLYCDFHLDNLHDMVDAMTREQIEVRRYPVIKVDVDKEGSFYCLNEFTMRSGIIRTLVMDVFIDGLHFETVRGDGLVVSTPTGSTGYNKSILGAVVDPLLPCMQVSELASMNNNRYRTLGSSFILSGERTLELKVAQDGNDFPIMGMDNEALSIQQVDEIKVELSDRRIKTVKLKDNSFWEKVKRSFL